MSNEPLAQENPPPNEAACIDRLAARLKAKIIKDNTSGIMRRDAHAKMHGIVRAEFSVEPDLPSELRVGLFSQPRTYQAWIRFSNQQGTIDPDSKRDIRGMAIKVMGVAGEKLLAQEKDAATQDFIVISTNQFVTRDVQEFDAMIQAITGGLPAMLWFFLTHWRVTLNLLKSLKQFANPLQMRYWSCTPYLLGPGRAVKYSAIPRATGTPDTIPDPAGGDFLREAMVRQLSTREAQFDFTLQLQTDAQQMPIEDPGALWSEQASPFRKVANIRIPPQTFDTDAQRSFGENVSFTPWHSLPEHRPLGGINRARKVVYDLIAAASAGAAAIVAPGLWRR